MSEFIDCNMTDYEDMKAVSCSSSKPINVKVCEAGQSGCVADQGGLKLMFVFLSMSFHPNDTSITSNTPLIRIGEFVATTCNR